MRPSSEALLVSSMINLGDASLGPVLGVDPDMLVGYQPEYRWVLSYAKTYGNSPSAASLLTKFPDFPITDYKDAAFAADEVRQSHNQRMLKMAIRTASQHIQDGDYDDAAMAIATYSPTSMTPPLTNTLHDLSFLDTYDESVDAMELPWRTLQRFSGGMRKGELWYMAARTNKGKSWAAGKIVAHAVLAGARVRFYSLEMSEEQVRTRMHVLIGQQLKARVDHIAMRDRRFDPTEYRRLINKIRDEVAGTLLVHDQSKGRVSPATVAAHAATADLHVVDHIGLMSTPLGKRSVEDWRHLAAISNELKEVVVGQDTRVLGMVQINREGDSPGKYPPKLKNLGGSDALGQDGDVVITFKDFSKTSRIYSLEKNRNGENEVLWYSRFLPNVGDLEEISRDRAEALRDREQER